MESAIASSFAGKRILVTGGTGSLGKTVVRRLLGSERGKPAKVIVFSRDEGKHHQMRVQFARREAATEDIAYADFERYVEFRVGDVRDYSSVSSAVKGVDIVVHAAALKQVPSCEYFPHEAARTNVEGAYNVVRAILDHGEDVQHAVAISTDKACKPINVMGMTKAIQERIFVEANLTARKTSFSCVRYGNVVASRGSVVPLFAEQIAHGGPITVTTPEMTRFLLTLEDAVDTVFSSLATAERGETYVPRLPSARITDLAKAMMGDRDVPIEFTGIRPGEKIHELLISKEESIRTVRRDGHFVIRPMLPELAKPGLEDAHSFGNAYSSADNLVGVDVIREILERAGKFVDVLA